MESKVVRKINNNCKNQDLGMIRNKQLSNPYNNKLSKYFQTNRFNLSNIRNYKLKNFILLKN